MIKPALYQLTSAFSILNTDFFNCILSRYHYHTHVLTPNTYIRIVQYCREGAYTAYTYTYLSVWHRTQRRSSSASLCNVKYEMVLSGQIINRVRCLRKQNAVMGMCKCRKWLVATSGGRWAHIGHGAGDTPSVKEGTLLYCSAGDPRY